MKENTKNILIGAFAAIAGLSTLGVVYTSMQTRSMRKMIAGSTERIANLSHVDIDRRMVEQMIQKSVRDQAGAAAREAADKVQHDVAADLKNRVKQIIGNQTQEINRKVASTIADEMAEINRDDIVEEVISQTTEKLVDKLGDDLDNEVGRIGKIYKGIAAALQ